MNLFDDPGPLVEERFDALLTAPGLRIERIVSHGHASPPDFWYDQPQAEWVLVIEGSAIVAFEDGRETRLERGHHLLIPAHARHRVAWTDPDRPTIWLAVHFG